MSDIHKTPAPPDVFQFRSGAATLAMYERPHFVALPATEQQALRDSHPTNQDYYTPQPGRLPKGVYGVADGMGGYQRGEIASSTVCTAFADYLQYVPPLQSSVQEAKENTYKAAEYADRKLLHEQGKQGLERAGTTLSALLFAERGTKALLFNAGDSVIFHIRAGSILLRTTTQCLPQTGELTNCFTGKGRPTPEIIEKCVQDAAQDPRSATIASWEYMADQLIVSNVESGDRFILATDGLTGSRPHETIRPDTICFEALRHDDPQHAAEALAYLPERIDPNSYIVDWTEGPYRPYRPKLDDLTVVVVDAI